MVEELIKEIRENPETREEVRRLILTDELLALPPVVEEIAKTQSQIATLLARMDARQDRMDARQDRMESSIEGIRSDVGKLQSDVGEIRSDVGKLQSDVGEIRSDVGKLQSDVGEIRSDMKVVKGASLESYLHVQMSSRAANLFDLRRISIVRGPLVADPTHDFENSVAKALNEGVIAQTQSDRIFNTDLIVRGQDRKSRVTTYVAVEAAFTVGPDDIRKVEASSLALKAVFPEGNVRGAVYGVNISDSVKQMAESIGYDVVPGEMPV